MTYAASHILPLRFFFLVLLSEYFSAKKVREKNFMNIKSYHEVDNRGKSSPNLKGEIARGRNEIKNQMCCGKKNLFKNSCLYVHISISFVRGTSCT